MNEGMQIMVMCEHSGQLKLTHRPGGAHSQAAGALSQTAGAHSQAAGDDLDAADGHSYDDAVFTMIFNIILNEPIAACMCLYCLLICVHKACSDETINP